MRNTKPAWLIPSNIEDIVADAGAVFMLPMIGMEPDCAIRIAEDFQELVSRLEI